MPLRAAPHLSRIAHFFVVVSGDASIPVYWRLARF
ncbi:hypothetical protein bAD24_III04780 [Burkholderia sp. AD24]|nr:hypothetical protein bAD24_III04780 [Burkholderia sp. AD24]